MARNSPSLRPWLLPLALTLGGCSNLGFYAQAISGHFDLLARRQPVAELLADPATPDPLRQRLELASTARDFASRELHLPDNASYRSFSDLQRPYVTWNVVAAEEFSVQAKVWCYLHLVCLPYRGYFDPAAAEGYAAELGRQGYDVHVYGIAAYSTSGWFDDPLLNTMTRLSERRMVGLIFHELAHQQLFLKRDGAFSEAFATFVEQEGLRRWLAHRGDEAGLGEYREELARRADFLALLRKTRAALETVYAGDGDAQAKRRRKEAAFAQMREDYAALEAHWGGQGGYDRWFAMPLNNARLVAVATYNDRVPAFAAMLGQTGGDLPAFYRAAAELAALPAEAREQRLGQLLAAAERR